MHTIFSKICDPVSILTYILLRQSEQFKNKVIFNVYTSFP